MKNDCFILLGSNIDPHSNIRQAIDLLDQHLKVIAVSKIYETKPIRKNNVSNYLNAVVQIESDHSPKEIKYNYLRKIEKEMGRVRTSDKFKPRVIDLDLILYNDIVYDDGDIVLPDPEITNYAHVAIPLSDLIPYRVHPIEHLTYKEIADQLREDSELDSVKI